MYMRDGLSLESLNGKFNASITKNVVLIEEDLREMIIGNFHVFIASKIKIYVINIDTWEIQGTPYKR